MASNRCYVSELASWPRNGTCVPEIFFLLNLFVLCSESPQQKATFSLSLVVGNVPFKSIDFVNLQTLIFCSQNDFQT